MSVGVGVGARGGEPASHKWEMHIRERDLGPGPGLAKFVCQ